MMSKSSITRVSLSDAKAMRARGEVHHDPDAPAGESLGRDFWAKAQVVEPDGPQPVLLKLDPDVFEFFKSQGKGHITRMQNVLRAYVNAHRGS
jgi:uncharacterized protein (DUF4415 family)